MPTKKGKPKAKPIATLHATCPTCMVGIYVNLFSDGTFSPLPHTCQ